MEHSSKNLLIKIGLVAIAILIIIVFWSVMIPIFDNSDFLDSNNKATTIALYGMIFITSLILLMPIFVLKKINKTYKYYISLENVPYEFESIYENLYNRHINFLEKERKKIMWRVAIKYMFLTLSLSLLFIPVLLHDFISLDKTTQQLVTATSLAFLGIFALIHFSNIKHKEKYKKIYEKEVISDFVKLINPQLTCNTVNHYKIKQKYIEAKFEEKDFDVFYTYNYIEGYLNNKTLFEMSNIFVREIYRRHMEDIFKGIFAFAKSSKDIGTYIKISKDKIKILDENGRMKFNNLEFEKYFDVYSHDKTIATKLITQDFMQILLNFYNKYHLDFDIVFINDNIYLRFFTDSLFEPNIFGNSIDKQDLFIYYSTLKFIIEITEKVNSIIEEIEF